MAKRLSVYLIILGFLLGNLVKIPIFHQDIKVSPLDFALMIAYLVALFKVKKSKFPKINSSLLLFTSWLLLSLLLNANSQNILSGLAYYLRYCLYIFSYYPLSILFSKSEKYSLITALAIMFPLLGAIQYFWFPDLRPFTIYGWDMHYYRVFGTYLDPGYYGLILFWGLVYLVNRPILWTMSYLVFAFTYSRSSFLAFAVGFTKSLKLMPYLLILVTIFTLPRFTSGEGVRLERTNSVVSRFDNWQDSLNIVKKSPLIGIGFNLLRFHYQEKVGWEISHATSGSDSSLVFVLTTSGLIGLFLYLKLLLNLWLYVRKDQLLSTLFIALFIHSFFLNSQFYPPIILLFSLSLAFKADKTL